jgi:hypothetical protein
MHNDLPHKSPPNSPTKFYYKMANKEHTLLENTTSHNPERCSALNISGFPSVSLLESKQEIED